jgi:SlyX protein
MGAASDFGPRERVDFGWLSATWSRGANYCRAGHRMHKIEALETRVETLETRVAHQDRMLEDLNATITDQWKQIESLTRKIARLDEQLQDVRSSGPTGEQEPPPHY